MDMMTTTPSAGAAKPMPTKPTLTVIPLFSRAGDPYDQVKWKKVDAVIKAADGTVVFELKGVEAPETWSQRAINIVAEKYFRIINGVRETSVRQLIDRVASTISRAGYADGLFTLEAAEVFKDELKYLLVNQMFAFNSPVWFNIGVPGAVQQASACFINSVEDTMSSITDLGKTEILLFKGGSGAGSNLSKLRSSYEKLSGGGSPSGPVSFMKWLDAGAGVTKSGGTTRRAALMRVLNVDHPDILTQANGEPGFITCKTEAEKIAQALIAAGFSSQFNKAGNAYDLSPFQNANNSVRVTDAFMQAVINDDEFQTKARTTGDVVHTYKAREIWDAIANAAWASGDPGLQFDTATNKWHTIPNTERINASNPCSEFLHIDDTSCNLGSFNLLKFLDRESSDNRFNLERFIHAVQVCITAMEILVGYAAYPTEAITRRTRESRPLGIGYANLGTLLMVKGLPYDSEAGRQFAAQITAVMSGTGYARSAQIAKIMGPFEYYKDNKAEMLSVIAMHREAAKKLDQTTDLGRAAAACWIKAYADGAEHGYRNSQISVLAPTGTIGFMMDCDTTGIEPMLALTQFKKLVGGGYVKMPARAVPEALTNLGYSGESSKQILSELEVEGEFGSSLRPEHRKVFQTAIGGDPVSTDGHLLMMAAVQPFLSGGISKTVNMQKTATVDDVRAVYMKAWSLGLKCVAIYRDECKASQPASSKEKKAEVVVVEKGLKWGERKRLPDERQSVTHKFSIGGQDGYFHLGLNDDGTPGELFINIAKAGSTLHGLVDMAATAISLGLQYGVPLDTLLEKFHGVRFEPSGFTGNPKILRAESIADYFAKWMELRTNTTSTPTPTPQAPPTPPTTKKNGVSLHGDPCRKCGNITVRAGTCWVCASCGTTTGCG